MKFYSKRKTDYKIDFFQFIELVRHTWDYFYKNDYFVEKTGIEIQKNSQDPISDDVSSLMMITLHFNPLPINEVNYDFNHDKAFDFIEFLYQYCSKPLGGEWFDEVTYNEYRYKTYHSDLGKQEFLEKVNSYLPYYEEGYELLPSGEIVLLKSDVQEILNQQIPEIKLDELAYIPSTVQKSIIKFRNKKSDFTTIKDSLNNLASVNERLKEFIKNKKLLNETETQLLFNICHNTANNFSIRHDKQKQRRDYDPIFLSMLFHIYLSTIHAAIRIINSKDK